MDIVKIEHHIKHLEEKHHDLDKQIHNKELSGRFSDYEMQILKKEKLHLKDEIEQLKHRMMA